MFAENGLEKRAGQAAHTTVARASCPERPSSNPETTQNPLGTAAVTEGSAPHFNATPAPRPRSFFKNFRVITILAALGGGFAVFQCIPISRPNDAGTDFDMQVVLGGNTRERSDVCHALWLRHPTPILVTGDDDYIRDELLHLGIPTAQILHEPTARSTWQNAELSVPILRRHHVTSAVIVTSWFHTARAHACFTCLDSRITFASQADPVPTSFGREQWKLATKERLKRLAYWISHGLNPWRSAK